MRFLWANSLIELDYATGSNRPIADAAQLFVTEPIEHIEIEENIQLMSFLPTSENVVAKGTFLYDGTVECDICIVFSPVRYGRGDHEDPPETQNDIEVDTYYLWFGSTTERNRFNAGGGGFSSLQEAMKNAEGRPVIGSTVQWV